MGRSSRRSSSPVRALLGAGLSLIVVFVLVHNAGALSTAIGGTIADRVVESVEKPNNTELAAWQDAANAKFVPAMHRKFPRLVHGVPDNQVARIATHTCTVLDGYAHTPHYQAVLRRDTRRALTHGQTKPTRKRVNAAIRTAGHTTCPEKDYLAGQFQ